MQNLAERIWQYILQSSRGESPGMMSAQSFYVVKSISLSHVTFALNVPPATFLLLQTHQIRVNNLFFLTKVKSALNVWLFDKKT